MRSATNTQNTLATPQETKKKKTTLKQNQSKQEYEKNNAP